MDAAVSLHVSAPSRLRLAVAECDAEGEEGPTRLFTPALALVVATDPRLCPAATSVAAVDRTFVHTPRVGAAEHSGGTTVVGYAPVMPTCDRGTTVVEHTPVMLTPDRGTTVVDRAPSMRAPEGALDSTSAGDAAASAGVPTPITYDVTHVRVPAIAAARVVVAGRYLEGGEQLAAQSHDIGSSWLLARTPRSAFADDPYVDAEHGALSFRPDGVAIEDFDSTNGVFARIRDRATLRCGDTFRAGEELLRFTALRRGRSAGGAPSLGSPDPGYWGRIDVMLCGDANAASYPIDDAEMAFGRTDGHLQFPDDPYLGALHCSVVRTDRGASLVDHGAEAGTWLRLRTGDVVPYGAELLVGQTRLRIERD